MIFDDNKSTNDQSGFIYDPRTGLIKLGELVAYIRTLNVLYFFLTHEKKRDYTAAPSQAICMHMKFSLGQHTTAP